MSWKMFSVLSFSAALAVSYLATAAESKTPDPAALGQLESVLDSCSAAKNKSAADYKKQRDRLTGGVAEKELDRIRHSQEYKEAYDSMRERFDHASSDEVNQACSLFLGKR